jgi:sugar phosphate isomerase/epimerase
MQNYEEKRERLVAAFRKKLSERPEFREQTIKLSWSNWGFGRESLEQSARRLGANGIRWIELHGNRYGDDLGYRAADVLQTLKPHGIQVAGICGMFSAENDLSSNSGLTRQAAIDYIRRQLDLAHGVGASYLLVVPAAVGRPHACDDGEFDRSVETLRVVADDFRQAGVRAAIEPIRSAEVSIVHTIAEARKYIAAVDHPGIQHINGDVYHMQSEESNIAEALLEAGDRLVNLHLADSNRCALGDGSLDVDAVLMALYVLDYPDGLRFATPEPLGPGGDPYPAMFGKPSGELLDKLVADTVRYWRERECQIKVLATPCS